MFCTSNISPAPDIPPYVASCRRCFDCHLVLTGKTFKLSKWVSAPQRLFVTVSSFAVEFLFEFSRLDRARANARKASVTRAACKKNATKNRVKEIIDTNLLLCLFRCRVPRHEVAPGAHGHPCRLVSAPAGHGSSLRCRVAGDHCHLLIGRASIAPQQQRQQQHNNSRSISSRIEEEQQHQQQQQQQSSNSRAASATATTTVARARKTNQKK